MFQRDGVALQPRVIEDIIDQAKQIFATGDDGAQMLLLYDAETRTRFEDSRETLLVRICAGSLGSILLTRTADSGLRSSCEHCDRNLVFACSASDNSLVRSSTSCFNCRVKE